MVEAVIIAKEGRIGICIDICLEMSGGIETPRESNEEEAAQTKPESTQEKPVTPNITDLLGLEEGDRLATLNLEDNRSRSGASVQQINLMD